MDSELKPISELGVSLVKRIEETSRKRFKPPERLKPKIQEQLDAELQGFRSEVSSSYRDALVGDEILGVKLINQLPDVGTFGKVFQAKHLRTGEELAIKVIHADLVVQRLQLWHFRRGVEAMEELRDVNRAIQIVNSSRNRLAYTMPYYRRTSLKTEDPAGWSNRRRDSFFLDLCRVVAATHAKKIVHRDIKPANVLLDEEGGPVLTDFDIADLLFVMTDRTAAAHGVVSYAAPEHLSPGASVDLDLRHRGDIYSLGRILYHLYTGETPDVHDLGDKLAQKAMEAPPFVRACVATACQRDMRGRYGTVDELIDEFVSAKNDSYESLLRKEMTRAESLPDSEAVECLRAAIEREKIVHSASEDELSGARRQLRRAERKSRRLGWVVGGVVTLLGVLGSVASLLSYVEGRDLELQEGAYIGGDSESGDPALEEATASEEELPARTGAGQADVSQDQGTVEFVTREGLVDALGSASSKEKAALFLLAVERGYELNGLDFSDAEFPDNMVLGDAKFEGVILNGSRLHKAKIGDGAFPPPPKLEFMKAHFELSDSGEPVDLEGATIVNVDFSGGYFSGAKFEGASMVRVDLKGADLSGAHFVSMRDMQAVNFRRAKLDGARFVGVDMSQATWLTANQYCKADHIRWSKLKGDEGVWEGEKPLDRFVVKRAGEFRRRVKRICPTKIDVGGQ